MLAPTAVVAAPSPVFRAGIRCTLEAGGTRVVAESGSYEHVLLCAGATRPDVCLLDSALLGELGAGVRALLREVPRTAVLVLGEPLDRHVLMTALRAGARGFLARSIDLQELPHAVAAVASGEALIPRRLVGELVAALRDHPAGRGPLPGRGRLTEREQQVLDLLQAGWSNRSIAEQLCLSPVTVRTHVASLARKLGAGDRAALVELSDQRVSR